MHVFGSSLVAMVTGGFSKKYIFPVKYAMITTIDFNTLNYPSKN